MSHPDPPNRPSWPPHAPPPGHPPQAGPPQPGPPQHFHAPAPGGPPGPAGPAGPGGPAGPTGGQYAAPYGPPPRRSRTWMIPTAAGAAVVLLAGTVWATTSIVDGMFGGPQPESVLPGNSFVFAALDLKVDGSQAVDLLRFTQKLPDELTEELDGEESADPGELISELVFPDVDYAQRIEPWIGQRVGIALWEPSDPEAASGGPDEPAVGVALAVTDERLADEELGRIRQEKVPDLVFEVIDDFALISDSPAGLADLHGQVGRHGSLEDQDVFSQDMGTLDRGRLASQWLDVGALMDLEAMRPGSPNDPLQDAEWLYEAEGRIATSLSIDGDFLEMRSEVLGFEFESLDTAELARVSSSAADTLGDLPDNTFIAAGGSGLDLLFSTVWEEDLLSMSDRDRREAESFAQEVGTSLPGGFTDILGSSTAFGITDFANMTSFFDGAEPDLSFTYRAVGGDVRVLEAVVEDMVADSYGRSAGVSADGDAAVASYGTSGTGRLADDGVFQQTMRGMDTSVFSVYFDLRSVLDDEPEVRDASQWGAVGASLSVSEDGERWTAVLRWAPSA